MLPGQPNEPSDHLHPLDKPELEVDYAPTDPVFGPESDLSAWRAREIRRILAEKARRQAEALRLYEPLPSQHQFHLSKAGERIVRGSNRAGKTLAPAVEVARAVTGQDPWNKYPKENGRWFCVAKDGKEVAQVMWRKLARAGAFRIIRDPVTNQWRAFRPLNQWDQENIDKSKPAPPLIPRRFIKSIAWENKKENQPSTVLLHNGWELNFFSSLGKPPHGSDIDGAWFDEEIVDPDWYPEISARLLDRRGKFIWGATPQAGTEQLFGLHERAQEEHGKEQPAVAEFVMRLRDNPHVSEEAKRDFAAKLSEQEYEVRFEGEFALLSYKVFPEFDKFTYTSSWFDVPVDWTHYAVVDPGRQVCAVLFAAVPPPDRSDHVYLYDELYLRNCDAELFGQEMMHKTRGKRFHAFVIDHQGGRMHEAGGGLTVETQYSAALKKYKVQSTATGYNFAWGNSDVHSGLEACRALLRKTRDEKPRLLVLSDKCPNFIWEMEHYRFKRVKQQVTEDPENRGRVHLMACLRYLASYPPKYVKPPTGKAHKSGAIAAFRAKQKRRKERDGGKPVRLGL